MPRPGTRAAAVLLVAALGLTGCGSASGGSDSAVADKGVAAPERAQTGAGAAADSGTDTDRLAGGDDRKAPRLAPAQVIRTATLSIRVKDVPAALDEVRTATENAGGYIGEETTDRDTDDHEQSRLVLRVPQEEYQQLLDELTGTGELVERKVDAKDVTDQVVDVKSRIESQRASVARVRELMDRATQLTDVVTLEGELSTRQTELEALLAQQASLKERTAMATVTLVLAERDAEKPPSDDEPSFLSALAGGWDAFVTALRWIAVALGAVLPFAGALALLLLLWRLALRFLPRRAALSRSADGAAPLGAPAGPPPARVPGPASPDPEA